MSGTRHLLTLATLTSGYFVAGKLGLLLAFVHTSATAVWPPTGIAIAAFLLLGYRVWPAILLGAFLVNLTTPGSLLSAAGIAAGNTLEGLAAAYLVNSWANGRRTFERPQDVFKFALLAALAATSLSATIGVSSLALTGFANWSDAGPIWLTWWLGDAGGALIVAPLLVLWSTQRSRLWDTARKIEALAVLALLLVVGLLVFGGFSELSERRYPLGFLTFPVLVWAAFRFGPREAATAIFALAGIAIWGTLRGVGPFARETQNESLLLVQAFMGVSAVVSLGLGAAVLERRRAEETIRETEARLRMIEEGKVAARDEFLSVAAHELKTPMTSLQVGVQFLLRELERGAVEGPRLQSALGTIEAQVSRLGRLVVELLDTARVQAGRLELDVQREVVSALVARAVALAQAGTRRHELVVRAATDAVAMVDVLRFEQVVANVLDNAIKFSPDGGRIDVDVSQPDPEHVRVTVRDRGIGIPPEHRARVFERFYQAHPESHRSGLGLGLHVSRQIVELHGGRIVAEFPEDGGTRIVVEVPTGVAERDRLRAAVR